MNDTKDTKTVDVSKSEPRELLALDGNEISVVDKPAIRRKFLIVKNEDGKMMGLFQPEEVEAPKVAPVADTFETEIGAATAAVEKSFADSDWTEVEVEKAAMPKGFADTLKASLPSFEKAVKALEGEERTKAMASLTFLRKVAAGKLPFPSFLAPKGKKEKTTKNEDGNVSNETPKVQVAEDGTVSISGEPIAKANKQFTAARIETLKDSLGSLVEVLHEAGGIEAVKAAMKRGMPGADLPDLQGSSAISSGVRPAATSGVKKNEDGSDAVPVAEEATGMAAIIKKALEPLTSTMGLLGERLDVIEKVRAPSQAEGEDTTTQEPVEKSEGIGWGNVL